MEQIYVNLLFDATKSPQQMFQEVVDALDGKIKAHVGYITIGSDRRYGVILEPWEYSDPYEVNFFFGIGIDTSFDPTALRTSADFFVGDSKNLVPYSRYPNNMCSSTNRGTSSSRLGYGWSNWSKDYGSILLKFVVFDDHSYGFGFFMGKKSGIDDADLGVANFMCQGHAIDNGSVKIPIIVVNDGTYLYCGSASSADIIYASDYNDDINDTVSAFRLMTENAVSDSIWGIPCAKYKPVNDATTDFRVYRTPEFTQSIIINGQKFWYPEHDTQVEIHVGYREG